MRLSLFVHLFGRKKKKKNTLFFHFVHWPKEVAVQCPLSICLHGGVAGETD